MLPTKAEFGNTDLEVSRLGLGCMGMSGVYGQSSEEESIRTIHRSIELGCTFLDTADIYGNGHNEELVGRAIKNKRDGVFLATKFGLSGLSHAVIAPKSNGKPEYVKEACEKSLKRLGVETIDLYYLHRLDQDTRIEDTVGAMSQLVEEGKVRFLGLSEISAKTLKRADVVHPISAVQSEYSLWWREPEKEILPLCRERKIAFVPYSPLGRGMLTGKIQSPESLDEKDWRHNVPRFQSEAFKHNLKLAQGIEQIAKSLNITAGQLALAWLLNQGQDIFPIPGTKRIKYLEENWAAVQIKLSTDVKARIEKLLNDFSIQGNRYPEVAEKLIDRS
jgi:aryl-alcohol dehydrogenase-like predicted oxidoreductase